MPFKRSKRTFKKKRLVGRRVRRRNISFVRPKFISGPPQQQLIKFVYNTDQLIFVPSLTGTNFHTHAFRANSLHDPDATGAGGQPRFYDEFMAMYVRWKVLGCKIEVEGIVETAGAGAKIFICPLTSGGAAMTNWNQAAERKLNTSILATNNKKFKISRYMSIHTMNQVRSSVVQNEDGYSGSVAFNPTIVPQWQLSVAGMDATLGTVQVVARVRLTYFTKVYQVRPVPAS